MIRIVTPPSDEPVTVADAKMQTVISHAADDSLLAIMISAAREQGELETGRSWAEQTLEVVLSAFPSGKISLRMGPVTSVLSVKYLDSAGTTQALLPSEYDVDLDSLIACISPVDGGSWPAAKVAPGSVRVQYKAGWDVDTFPVALKQWLLVRVASLYAQREGHIVGSSLSNMPRGFADVLLDRYRVPEVA